MNFQNSVILEGVVTTIPKKIKNDNDKTLIQFKMFTSIRRTEKGEVLPNPVTHVIVFESDYTTIFEHMKKGHSVIVTGAISNDDKTNRIIRASSVNWEEGQLINQYPETEETFEANIDE